MAFGRVAQNFQIQSHMGHIYVLCGVIFYYIALPKIIERRAEDLGLLRYNSKVDKMVEKDSLHISGWDLHYLKKGTMDGYVGF